MKVIKDGIVKTWKIPIVKCPNCHAENELEIEGLRKHYSPDPMDSTETYFFCFRCCKLVYFDLTISSDL